MRLPDVILYVHWGWLILMTVSPLILPWYVISLMSGIVLAMNSFNDMKCPITEWEFHLRWDAQERKLCSLGMFRDPPRDLKPGAILTSHRGRRYYVHSVERGRPVVVVTDYLPMRSAMERLFEKCGVNLGSKTIHVVTFAVLLGAPVLAYFFGR